MNLLVVKTKYNSSNPFNPHNPFTYDPCHCACPIFSLVCQLASFQTVSSFAVSSIWATYPVVHDILQYFTALMVVGVLYKSRCSFLCNIRNCLFSLSLDHKSSFTKERDSVSQS
jgi:hypothetical protein